MASEQIPVTPSVITWARVRSGLSLEEATQTFRNIAAWEDEASDIFPTYPQLEKLAEKFKVPIAVFFFPAPPNVPPIGETFRTLPEAQFSDIPREVQTLLRKARALQLNLSELNDDVNPADRLITRDLAFPADVQVDEMAREVRAYLGVNIDQQQNWESDVAALENWRKILNNVGISIFKDAFKVSDYSGFCLYDDIFPVIYVNNSTAKTRQIFTLFHELAHLLFHTSGIDTRQDNFLPVLVNDARRIEIICNEFAARFLVPEDAFARAFAGQLATEETAEELAAIFHVSRESIFRKFLDRNLIDQVAYRRAALRWAEQLGVGGTGGNWYNTKIAYLGRDYVNLAFSKFYQNRINEAQLAEYLDTKPRNLSTLEEYFVKRAT
jgi:Zn-dependent peptidase ImmA (M78 family)